MKFLKENWFKLMTGTSILVFSFAFLMYAVSPSYANYTKEVNKPQIESQSTGEWVLRDNGAVVKMNTVTGEAYIMSAQKTGTPGGYVTQSEYDHFYWDKIRAIEFVKQ